MFESFCNLFAGVSVHSLALLTDGAFKLSTMLNLKGGSMLKISLNLNHFNFRQQDIEEWRTNSLFRRDRMFPEIDRLPSKGNEIHEHEVPQVAKLSFEIWKPMTAFVFRGFHGLAHMQGRLPLGGHQCTEPQEVNIGKGNLSADRIQFFLKRGRQLWDNVQTICGNGGV